MMLLGGGRLPGCGLMMSEVVHSKLNEPLNQA